METGYLPLSAAPSSDGLTFGPLPRISDPSPIKDLKLGAKTPLHIERQSNLGGQATVIHSEDQDPGDEDSLTLTQPLPARRQYSLSGLRVRLIIFVAVILAPAFGITLYTGYRGRETALHDARHNALILTQQTAAREARAIENTHAVLRVLAVMPVVRTAKNPCQASMLRYALALHGLATIGVANSAGQVLCSVGAPLRAPSKDSNSWHFQKTAARSGFALTDYQRPDAPNNPLVIATRPVKGPSGHVERLLFARLPADWLTTTAARAHLPKGTLFMVVDRRGGVVARYLNGARRQQSPTVRPAELRQLGADSRARIRTVRSGGHEWLVTDTTLTNSLALQGLRTVVAIPATVAYAAVNHTLHRNLSALGAVGAFSLMLAWVLGDRLLLRPVHKLAAAAHRIAGGDMTARTGIVSGPDEIRSLGHAFDYMASSLERRARHSRAQSGRIARLNRIHQVLSAINGAILRIRDRDQLLQEACRIAVELGQFRFAWVGLSETARDTLHVVAHAGDAWDFVEGVRVTLNPNEPEGRGLMGTAIRSALHAVSNTAQTDPRLLAWREDFIRLGIHSVAAFPLRIQGAVVGALALYTNEPNFFDDREIEILQGLAADTSLGLEQIEKDRQLNYLAYWDPLTNLANRTLLEDRLGQSIRRAERSGSQVVVLGIDVLGFARINDSMGRAAGDQILQTIAARLSAVVRESESLAHLGSQAGRLGSHEFALILDDVSDPLSVKHVADRIHAIMTEPVSLEDGEATITLRMGVATYPEHGAGAGELLHRAQFAAHSHRQDQPPYLAFYSPEKDTQAKAGYALEADLRRAVDNEEFFLEYQPRVDAQTGRMTGAEALLRWERPGHGRMPPDQFIPVLEETGLIDRVGEWVARTAFAQRLAWQQRVPETFVVAINASSHELRTPDYVSRIRRLQQAVGIPAGWLEIEITETGLVEGGNATLEMLSTLKTLGFRLSVDDFGTGYCSLNYLRQFPVDTLKIDKSFINDITHDKDALVIVRSILALAGAMKLTVVAEGVETEEQLRLLAKEGCDEVQGYYFSRPISAEALLPLMGAFENKGAQSQTSIASGLCGY